MQSSSFETRTSAGPNTPIPLAAQAATQHRLATWRRALLAPFAALWRHRVVVWEMSKREVLARYRGSMLGLLWSFSHPLLLLAIYSVVFGIIFEAKWSSAEAGDAPFALILFAGLIVYSIFAEGVSRAPTLILAYPSYVKKVVFPLEVLPWVVMASALFHATVSLLVLILIQTAIGTVPGVALLALPLLLLPVVLCTLGITWFLAALGVFFRDIVHTVSLFTTVVLFMSPVFYPMSALPGPLRAVAWINPLALVIEELRNVVFLAATPRWLALLAASAVGSLIAAGGLIWFEKTRPGFADVV